MVTKVYVVTDLIEDGETLDEVITKVRSTLGKERWNGNDGPCTVAPIDPDRLVIAGAPVDHDQIVSYLEGRRDQRELMETAEAGK